MKRSKMVMKTTTMMIPLATKCTNPNANDAAANNSSNDHQPKKKTLKPHQKEDEGEQPIPSINESSSTSTSSSSSSSATTSTTTTTTMTAKTKNNNIVRDGVVKEIHKQVLRSKLSKLRHLVIQKGINPQYLDTLFPEMKDSFDPQTVHYNGGIAQIKEWKISCYLEVMPNGIPCTNPNIKLLKLFQPLLDICNNLFLEWYRQQHSCNSKKLDGKITRSCKRIMTFITRYTPSPGEQALLKHVDGAGKVDGSCVVALPEEINNSFIGYGGGITFWDGINTTTTNDKSSTTAKTTREIHYETRSGDIAFIDRAVWHQADPITKGTRWALVIFYDVQTKLLSDS